MTTASILWRRLDRAGHDFALLRESPTGAIIEGTAVFNESGQPCRLDYRVACDGRWHTVSARLTGWRDTTALGLSVERDAAGRWSINGEPCQELRGCEDIDLSFSPATNLLPIRRAGLAVGEKMSARAAWLRFPALTLEPLDQTYHRVSVTEYRYESGGGAFVAMLETNAVGFVTQYPGVWQLEQG